MATTTTCGLKKTPHELISVISSYLDFSERKQFLSLATFLRKNLKQIRYISLNCKQFCRLLKDAAWKERIWQMVVDEEDPQPQRKLKVEVPWDLKSIANDFLEVAPYILSVKSMANDDAKLALFTGIPKVSYIGEITLFCAPPSVSTLSALSASTFVHLERLVKVTDLSPLQNVEELELVKMPKNLDVFSLKKLRSLKLMETCDVHNIARLPLLERLHFSGGCLKRLFKSFSAKLKEESEETFQQVKFNFSNMKYLHLENVTLDNSNLLQCYHNIKELHLTSFILRDWEMDYPVGLEKVHLSQCPNIESLYGLEMCKEITVENMKRFDEIGVNLPHCTKISLSDCYRLRAVNELAPIREVELYNCSIADARMLHAVQKLSIMYCNEISSKKYPVPSGTNQEWAIQGGRIRSLQGFEKLRSLRLIDCDHITDISNLGSLHEVLIVSCPIQDVSALKKVKRVYIMDCKQVVDVSMLAEVEELYLRGSTNIQSLDGLHNILWSEVPKKFQQNVEDKFFIEFQKDKNEEEGVDDKDSEDDGYDSEESDFPVQYEGNKDDDDVEVEDDEDFDEDFDEDDEDGEEDGDDEAD